MLHISDSTLIFEVLQPISSRANFQQQDDHCANLQLQYAAIINPFINVIKKLIKLITQEG